ncbi:MAG: MFS transporter [Pirellulaceae bacterium]|nr:MFS transporter [Pirellulaceae bacterium]
MAISGFVVRLHGWRAAFFVPPAFLLAMTAIFAVMGRGSPKDAGYQPEWEDVEEPELPTKKIGLADYLTALTDPRMNLAYLAGAGEKLVRIGILTWLVIILKRPVETGGFGLTIAQSTMIASLAFWGAVILSVVFGLMCDRVFGGQYWQTMMIGFLAGAVGLACLTQIDFILNSPYKMTLISTAIFVSGGAIQALETPLYLLPGKILGRERGATGVGIMNGYMYIGASLSCYFLGWWLDHFTISSMLLFLAGVCVLSSLVTVVIRR